MIAYPQQQPGHIEGVIVMMMMMMMAMMAMMMAMMAMMMMTMMMISERKCNEEELEVIKKTILVVRFPTGQWCQSSH